MKTHVTASTSPTSPNKCCYTVPCESQNTETVILQWEQIIKIYQRK